MKYDETSMYKSTSNLIKLLIRKDLPNAYPKRCLAKEKNFTMLHHFGSYKLEAIVACTKVGYKHI